jgi:hypothetical protein
LKPFSYSVHNFLTHGKELKPLPALSAGCLVELVDLEFEPSSLGCFLYKQRAVAENNSPLPVLTLLLGPTTVEVTGHAEVTH